LSLCAHGNARFRLQTPGQRPGGPKAISYQYEVEAEDTHFGGEPVAEGPSPAEKAFEAAAATSKTLRAAPDNDTLLALYSLYKQGSIGDATGARPGMMDVLGRAKFDAWAARKGLAREQAMADYVKLVASLKAREAETV
jgi:carboxylesterase